MIFCFETDSISPSGPVRPETSFLLIDRSGENYESDMYMRALHRHRQEKSPGACPEALFEGMELAADGEIIPRPR
jgi:hypothetical protein